jgi:high-affinity nickel-transport protein
LPLRSAGDCRASLITPLITRLIAPLITRLIARSINRLINRLIGGRIMEELIAPSVPLPLMLAMALLLGLRHGFDADHVAMIDGLSRANVRLRPRLARYCGLLFSLGHGGVVAAIAMAGGLLSLPLGHGGAPAWLDAAGQWISIVFLAAIGLANLANVLLAPADAVVAPVAVRGRWLRGLAVARTPLAVMLIGALFAVSFDTVGLAGLFAVAAGRGGGLLPPAALGLAFTAGMAVTDGANGLWISRLLARADRAARVASRLLGLVIALLSLLLAGFELLRRFAVAPGWGGGGDGMMLGGAIVAAATGAALLLLRSARTPAQPGPVLGGGRG